ncbi:MAG: thioredoxin, partial [Acidobacteriaceae bacterium]
MGRFAREGLLAALLCVTSAVTIPMVAQANPPEAPEAAPAQSAAPAQPSAAAPLPPMPPPDPKNFTAASPSKETVEAFL